MIKQSSIRRICVATLALFILLIIYFFPTKPVEIEEYLNYINKDEMPIFLVDNSLYVARTTTIKDSDEINEKIENILETLTESSKKSAYIKEGFKAVIPKNTKVLNYNLENEILTINFSKEFLNVSTNMEEKLIEAIVYSLTEIPEIKQIVIFVNNERLTHLPNSGRKLPEYLDKTYGINKIYNLDSIKGTSKTTIYYIGKNKDNYYYIPITKISNEKAEKVEIIIKELKETPIYHTNLISYLAASASITSYEMLESSMNLSFDNKLLAGLEDKNILEEVKYSIALSIRDTYGVNVINFQIAGQDEEKIEV